MRRRARARAKSARAIRAGGDSIPSARSYPIASVAALARVETPGFALELDVFLGHLERGGRPIGKTRARVERVVLFQSLTPDAPRPAAPRFAVFGATWSAATSRCDRAWARGRRLSNAGSTR